MEELIKKATTIDIFLKLVTYLPFRDVASICQTNKFYHEYCTDPKYNIRWKNLIDNTFKHIYDYPNILTRLWTKLNYDKDNTYNYIIYTQLVKLLDPITQLMIYHKQGDMVNFNDNEKFNNTQRFLAMFLLGNVDKMKEYLPPNDDEYLPFVSWVEGKELSQKNLNDMLIEISKQGNPLGVKLLLEKEAEVHAKTEKAVR